MILESITLVQIITYDKNFSVFSLYGKESACQYRRHKRCNFRPWVGKIPWSREWQPTLVLLTGKFHGQSSQAGYSLQGHKESDMTKWLSVHTHTHTHTHTHVYLCIFFLFSFESLLLCTDLLLWLFLLQSTSSRHTGFSSCSMWLSSCSLPALECRLNTCGAQT